MAWCTWRGKPHDDASLALTSIPQRTPLPHHELELTQATCASLNNQHVEIAPTDWLEEPHHQRNAHAEAEQGDSPTYSGEGPGVNAYIDDPG